MAETAEALDGLSQAAHFQGEYDRAIELKERAFAAYRAGAASRSRRPTLARWLAFLHGTFHGNYRGRERLDGARREPARGGGGVRRARLADPRPRAVHARRAAEREQAAPRRRSRSRAASATPTSSSRRSRCSARSTSPRGRLAEGMRLLDEAMAAISAGEVAGARRDRGDLLPAAERLRARDRRQARRGVDGGRPTATWPGRDFVAPDLPVPTTAGSWSRSVAGRRPRQSCSTRSRRSTRGYRGDRAVPARAARRPAGAPGPLRGGRAPARGRRLASDRPAGGRGDRAGARRPRAGRGARAAVLRGRRPGRPRCGPLLELLVEIQLGRDDVAARRERHARPPRGARRRLRSDELVSASAELAAGPRAGGGGRRAAPPPHLRRCARACSRRWTCRSRRRGRALELARALAPSSTDAAVGGGAARARRLRAAGRGARRGRGGRAAPRARGGGRAWPRGHGALTQARDGGAGAARRGPLERRDRGAARSSAAAPRSTTWRASSRSSGCEAAPRPPPTPCASGPKTRSEIGIHTDARGGRQRSVASRSRTATRIRRRRKTMSASEQNKAAVRDCFEQASQGNFDALPSIVTPGLRPAPGGGPRGRTAWPRWSQGYRERVRRT